MEELVDLIVTDAPASDIRDKINDLLYMKASERVDMARPIVASSMFGQESSEDPEEEGE